MLQVKLPLEVGAFMECEWKQGQYHRAKIIERRKRSDAPDYEYYVHYIGCEFYALVAFVIRAFAAAGASDLFSMWKVWNA